MQKLAGLTSLCVQPQACSPCRQRSMPAPGWVWGLEVASPYRGATRSRPPALSRRSPPTREPRLTGRAAAPRAPGAVRGAVRGSVRGREREAEREAERGSGGHAGQCGAPASRAPRSRCPAPPDGRGAAAGGSVARRASRRASPDEYMHTSKLDGYASSTHTRPGVYSFSAAPAAPAPLTRRVLKLQ
eukprot:scaffold30911_cov62-Phaeocystis_antarctica.AAC.4